MDRVIRVACAVGLVSAALGLIGYGYLTTEVPRTPRPASTPSPTPSPEPTPLIDQPDLSRILPVIGRDSMAHVCPVTPALALTSRHVVLDDHDNPYDLSFSRPNGQVSSVTPYRIATYADLASVVSRIDMDPYPRAALAPLPGERLWWKGYDFRLNPNLFVPRIFTGRVLRVVAGHVILDTTTVPGTSGSCLLNARGEVVAVVAWNVRTEDSNSATVGPGTWGDLAHSLLADADKAVAAARQAE